MVTSPPTLPRRPPLYPTSLVTGLAGVVDLAGLVSAGGEPEPAGADGFVVDWQLGVAPRAHP